MPTVVSENVTPASVNYTDNNVSPWKRRQVIFRDNAVAVHFDGNGSDGKTANAPVFASAGTKISIPACKYTKKGYLFTGWNTEKDGSGTTYKAGARTSDAISILYAQWQKSTAKVTLEFPGGKYTNASGSTWDDSFTFTASFSSNSSVTYLPFAQNMTKEGCTFAGWYTEPEYKKRIESLTIRTAIDGMTLYAKWNDTHEHVWGEGAITTKPTCTTPGVKTYTCSACQKEKTEKIPATGHLHTEIRNKKEATCKEDGYTGDVYCKDCGEKLSSGKTIAKTDHIWDSGRITKPATDTESGIKTYTCINCNTTRTEEIPATGEHLNTELRGAKSATCLEEGYTGDTYCKDCGTKLSSGTVIPKTGHIWDEGVVTKATTCTEKGIRTYTCSVCESTKIEEIPSTGHGTKITKFAKEATYTQEGYTGDIYCQDCGTLLEEGKVLAKLEQPKQTVTPGEMIGDKASNGVYKVLADGRSVEFVRQMVQSKVVKIPDTVSINGTIYAVTGISANAFKNNQLLRTTVIGRNVRRIGKQAFYNCKNLRTITIRTSMLTKKNIGTKAFKGTYKKIKVKVPAKQFKTYKKFFKSKGMSTKAVYKK